MQTASFLSAVVALSVASFAACGGTPAAPSLLVPLPSDAGVDAVSPAPDADVAETDVADTEAAPGPDLHTIWNKTFGPSSDFQYEGAVRLAGAPNGDIVLAGVYSGEALDFGGGPLTTTKGALVFLARFASDGHHLWATSLFATRPRHIHDLVVDGNGDIIVSGNTMTDINSSNPPRYPCQVDSDTQYGQSVSYVAKLKGDGSGCVWGHAIAGNGILPSRLQLAVDHQGNVLVANAGDASDAAWNGTPAKFLPSLTKLDATGKSLWKQDLPGIYIDHIAIDAHDAVYLASRNSTGGGLELTLAKLGAQGDRVWTKGFSGGFGTYPGAFGAPAWGALAVDDAGNIAVAGHFSGDVNLGGDDLHATHGLSKQSLLVASFDGTGKHVWSHAFAEAISDSGNQFSPGISISLAKREVVVAGSFWRTMSFGGSDMTVPGTADTSTNLFLSAFDAVSGTFHWQKALGDRADVYERGLVTDATGAIWLAATFYGAFDFESGQAVDGGSAPRLILGELSR